MNLNKKDYQSLGRWTQPVLSGHFWTLWHDTESTKRAAGLEFEPIVFIDGHTLMKKTDLNQLKNLVARMDNENSALSFVTNYEKVAQWTEDNHLATLDKKGSDLNSYLSHLFTSYQEVVGLWWLSLALGDVVQDYLIENKYVESYEELGALLGNTKRKTWLEHQNLEIKVLARALCSLNPPITPEEISKDMIEKNPLIKSHLDRFRWYGTHHWQGNGYDIDQCLDDLRKVQADSQHITPLLLLLESVMYWRTHCAELTAKVVFESRDELRACAKKLNLSYNQLLQLSHEEILKLLAELPKDLLHREKGYGAIIDERNQLKIITQKEFKDILDNLIEKPPENLQTLKGQVACRKGIVRGTVRVLLGPADFQQFKEQEILVAPETTPDFVPCMKRASAIITDRGGVTSHAAIVSRELEIPCIIGTKHATQILKNGQTVEVDTENGEVRVV